MSAILPEIIATIAESKIGLKESPSGSNRGPEIQEFFDADSYDPNGNRPGDDGYPWCAAFVCASVQKSMEEGGGNWTFARPTTPGAWDFERWSLEQDRSTWTKRNPGHDIARGDIVIFKFSHVAISTGMPDGSNHFPTVEGNTNRAGQREGTAVLAKSRHISEVKTRIRFTV